MRIKRLSMYTYPLGLIRDIILGRPPYIVFFVTSRCNAHCPFCFYWRNIENCGKRNELSLLEIERLTHNFPNLLHLNITGGEPFLRVDISEICHLFVKNCALQSLTIPTNCSLPEKIENDVMAILEKSKPRYMRICLSLQGVGKSHDDIIGMPGAFAKVIETYERLNLIRKRHANLDIQITSCLSSYNVNHMDELINYVAQHFEIGHHNILLMRGQPRDPGAKGVSCAEYKQFVEKANKNLIEMRNLRTAIYAAIFQYNNKMIEHLLEYNTMPIDCLAGRRLLIIDEEGKIFPCELLGEALGSLRDSNFSVARILSSSPARKILKQIREKKCACSYECAVQVSIAFNWRCWFKVFKELYALKKLIRKI